MRRLIQSFNPFPIVIIVFITGLFLFIHTSSVYAGGPDRHMKSTAEWLIITDSYGVTPQGSRNRTWPYQFQEMMGLPDSDMCFLRLNGYGYARRGHRYIDKVKALPKNQHLRRIIVTGGINNDKHEPLSEIKSEMEKLNRLFGKYFPNASVYMAVPNWNFKEAKHSFLRQRKALYRSYGKKLGWKWLPAVFGALEGETGWYQSDFHHPNIRGARLIAEAAFYSFRGYRQQYLVHYTPNGGTGRPKLRKYRFGRTYRTPACPFKKSGYTFAGWKDLESGQVFTKEDTIKNLSCRRNDVIEFSARWTKFRSKHD